MAKITGLENIKGAVSSTNWEKLLSLAQTQSPTPEQWVEECCYFNKGQLIIHLPEKDLHLKESTDFTDIPFQLRIDQYSSANSFIIEDCSHFISMNNLVVRHSNLKIEKCASFTTLGNNLSIGYVCTLENLPSLQKVGTLKARKLKIINAPSLTELPVYPNITDFSFRQYSAFLKTSCTPEQKEVYTFINATALAGYLQSYG